MTQQQTQRTDAMSNKPTGHMLEVPGACLYYETVGSGPVLALIGLPMTGPWFAKLASYFANDHTVVTYDPRGFGRSAIDDPEQDSTPELTADDVYRVLRAVSHEPAHVFGSSGGAVTGLALTARYPQQVRTLVAHEPPVLEMLPNAEQLRAQEQDIYDTYRTHGTGAAFGKFMALAFDMPEPDPAFAPPKSPEPFESPSEQDQADNERFFAHSILPTTAYRPDIAALKAAPTRVVIAGGETSNLARRAADALAEALGSPRAEFPGGHGGFVDPSMGFDDGEPEAFARVLRQTLYLKD
jgi:pimeloyl-ACP methyl ester carboxylesterase